MVGIAPVFLSPPSTTFTVGSHATFDVFALGIPLSVDTSESGTLPQGVTFATDHGVGVLSGTPAQGTAGTYRLTFTATNGLSTTRSLTLTVENPAPPRHHP
ncbi:MAG: putative Ig domain-containing protein [Acidimicrobiales bacterium]